MWFKSHPQFQLIFDLYRQYCSSPAASVDLERLWSAAGRLDTPSRTNMKDEFVCARLKYQLNRRVQLRIMEKGLTPLLGGKE